MFDCSWGILEALWELATRWVISICEGSLNTLSPGDMAGADCTMLQQADRGCVSRIGPALHVCLKGLLACNGCKVQCVIQQGLGPCHGLLTQRPCDSLLGDCLSVTEDMNEVDAVSMAIVPSLLSLSASLATACCTVTALSCMYRGH